MNKIIHGDCLEKLKDLPDNSVDSIVTDPPYELGFMGKSWDSTGIANNVDMWKECLRVLKPGGHLLAFSGTRTYHRMASAIEDAGFEVRDMIEWVYGSGFPKSLNIGKSVNQLETNEWSKIGKALDNVDQKSIMEVWKTNAKLAGIKLVKNLTGVGSNTRRKYFVHDIAVLYFNQEKENASAITAELNLCVPSRTSEENLSIAVGSVEQNTELSQNLVKSVVKLSENQRAKSWNIFTAQCDVKEWLKENTEVSHKVDEALKTLRGNKKYSNEEITNVLCAVLPSVLKLTILNQSKTFQNLDTKSKMDYASVINVIITEYTAENLISNTVAILKSKAVDKLQGNEREDLGPRIDIHSHGANCRKNDVIYPTKEPRATKGNSEWEGWGTALKPAHEPICMARKPLSEKTVAENCLKWGTGGINIDESRVKIPEGDNSGWSGSNAVPPSGSATDAFGVHKFKEVIRDKPELGRFPANLIHDNSEEVRECFPETKSRKSKTTNNRYISGNDNTKKTGDGKLMYGKISPENTHNDSGNASRFFKSIIGGSLDGRFPANLIHDNSEEVRECFPESKAGSYKGEGSKSGGIWSESTGKPAGMEYGDSGNASRFFKSIIYQAKSSKSERNKGCEGLYILKDNTPKDDIEEIKHLLSI